jgi:mannose-6-phosphate isomerase-like protein (cupin superfamily)
MKKMFLLAALALFIIATLLVGADAAGVNYVGHDKVVAALGKGGSLVSTPEFAVSGSYRNKPGQVEVHEKETDILYIVEGAATFVTGGTAVGTKITRPGQQVGTAIQGGQTHQLTKGDVITIPAGIPHWFKEVPQSVSYFVVKVLKQ